MMTGNLFDVKKLFNLAISVKHFYLTGIEMKRVDILPHGNW